MRGLAKAFTLVELLVIVAIISLLAAITFPVLTSAKAAAQRAVCISNMHQITAAVNLYADDYDGSFMLSNEHPGVSATSRTDRTWVQLVLPYTRSFAIFHCPGDTSQAPQVDATFDQDLVPGDTDSRYYTASMHTNYGLNYQYLSPIVRMRGEWAPSPRPMAQVQHPSDTIMLVDSVWTRSESGSPEGGGNYLITPPCRYKATRTGPMDSFNQYTFADIEVFTTAVGWNVEDEKAPNVHGNAWPWHNGRMNAAMVDGSVRSYHPNELTKGCQLQDEWRGSITDMDNYMWDTF